MSCNLQKINSCDSAILCDSNFDLINLYKINYCYFNSNIFSLVILILILIPIAFYILSYIADKYLSNSLSKVNDRLKIPESIAAMTIISFANSAPDLVTSILAGGGGGESSGPLISIGQLNGAFIFSSCVSLAFIILRSPERIIINKILMSKEILFYFLLIVFMMIFAYIGEISLLMIIFFMSFYIVYVVISIILNNKYQNEKEEVSLDADYNKKQLINLENKSIEIVENKNNTDIKNNQKYEKLENKNELKNFNYSKLFKFYKYIFKLTIPFEENNLIINKYIRFLIIFISSLFSLIAFKFDLNIKSIMTAISFSFIDFITLKNDIDFNFYFREFISIFSNLSWIFLSATIISDILVFVSNNFKINQIFLATVILAIGNTLGDLFSNAALSKNGKGAMVSYATFSNQTFNFFFGFGLNVLRNILTNKKNQDFNWFKSDGLSENIIFIIIIFSFCFISIFSTLGYLCFNKFSFRKKYSYVLFTIYFSYVVIISLFEFVLK